MTLFKTYLLDKKINRISIIIHTHTIFMTVATRTSRTAKHKTPHHSSPSTVLVKDIFVHDIPSKKAKKYFLDGMFKGLKNTQTIRASGYGRIDWDTQDKTRSVQLCQALTEKGEFCTRPSSYTLSTHNPEMRQILGLVSPFTPGFGAGTCCSLCKQHYKKAMTYTSYKIATSGRDYARLEDGEIWW